jgi:septal ring factor EnvC (AmiA/AmiB activator)
VGGCRGASGERVVQKKIAAAAKVIKEKEAKLCDQRQASATAEEELPAAEAATAELKDDVTAAVAKLDEMQQGVQGEVCSCFIQVI